MAWDINAVSAMAEYPCVFAAPSTYGHGIAFSDPMSGRHLFYAAEFLSASVETMRVPALTIIGARDFGGSLELSIRLAVPMSVQHLLLAAEFLTESVETMCIPPVTITRAREVGGSLELTIRLAVPITIDVPAEDNR